MRDEAEATRFWKGSAAWRKTATRGHGHCSACDRLFVLTYAGTIPAHTVKTVTARRTFRRHCAGSEQGPTVLRDTQQDVAR